MKILSFQENYYSQKNNFANSLTQTNQDFETLLKNTKSSKDEEKQITYGELQDCLWQKYCDGEIEWDTYTNITTSEIVANLVDSYNIYGSVDYSDTIAMQKSQESNPKKIANILERNLLALYHNTHLSYKADPITHQLQRVPQHIYEANKQKTKDFLLEIIENLKA